MAHKKTVTTIIYEKGSDDEWHERDKTVVIEEYEELPSSVARQVSAPGSGPYDPWRPLRTDDPPPLPSKVWC